MPDLIAQGPRRSHRWRRRLPNDELVTIGRDAGYWAVHWDDHVSRQHVKVRWSENSLHVEVLPRTNNPVFFQGTPVQTFRLRPGEHFVIGQTTFTLAEETASIGIHAYLPVTEQTFSQEYLRRLDFRDPSNRLQILSRLPERIASSSESTELHQLVVRVIMEGIPQAKVVALCEMGDDGRIEFLDWDRIDSNSPTINASQRLISEAINRGESVVHTWNSNTDEQFTEIDNIAWSFCAPFTGSSCKGWAIYVAGTEGDAKDSPSNALDLRDELKFTEVVITTIHSFYQVRQLQDRQSALRQFFSPLVIAAIGNGEPDQVLAPREVDVTVLFCDLRGFTLATEQSADDLLGLLQRVSDALGVLTKQILKEGGVIGDFHGDAAMGFWGWPLEQEDAAVRAARAAIAIRQEFVEAAHHGKGSLSNFRIGVGIASGRAVAGKIGTTDQVKVTAFGPAVNLASRLETMTKQLNTPILMDSVTAAQVRKATDGRSRRLALVQPYGMQSEIEVHELLPPEDMYPLLADEHIACYEAALDAFIAGDWASAWEKLHQVPASDTSKDFLTTYIASRSRVVPANWDGVIRLESK